MRNGVRLAGVKAGRESAAMRAPSVAPRPMGKSRVTSIEQTSPTNSSSACATRAPSAATISSPSSPRISMAGHRAGRGGADRGAVGDERLPEGAARAHPRRRLARADQRRRTTARRLAGAWPSSPRSDPRVVAAAPYVNAQGMLSFDGSGARQRRARHPARARGQGRRHRQPHDAPARSTALKPGEFGIVLGSRARARARRASPATSVTLIAPQGQVTPAGIVPRLKQFTRGRHFRGRHVRVRLAASR